MDENEVADGLPPPLETPKDTDIQPRPGCQDLPSEFRLKIQHHLLFLPDPTTSSHPSPEKFYPGINLPLPSKRQNYPFPCMPARAIGGVIYGTRRLLFPVKQSTRSYGTLSFIPIQSACEDPIDHSTVSHDCVRTLDLDLAKERWYFLDWCPLAELVNLKILQLVVCWIGYHWLDVNAELDSNEEGWCNGKCIADFAGAILSNIRLDVVVGLGLGKEFKRGWMRNTGCVVVKERTDRCCVRSIDADFLEEGSRPLQKLAWELVATSEAIACLSVKPGFGFKPIWNSGRFRNWCLLLLTPSSFLSLSSGCLNLW